MEEKKKLMIVMTRGVDDERSSVAWSIANGGVANGLEVSIFLTSNAVDWVREGAAERARPNPEDPPIREMMRKMTEAGSQIYVCPPCMKVRGYSEGDIIDGVTVIGSVAIHDAIKEGATVMTF